MEYSEHDPAYSAMYFLQSFFPDQPYRDVQSNGRPILIQCIPYINDGQQAVHLFGNNSN